MCIENHADLGHTTGHQHVATPISSTTRVECSSDGLCETQGVDLHILSSMLPKAYFLADDPVSALIQSSFQWFDAMTVTVAIDRVEEVGAMMLRTEGTLLSQTFETQCGYNRCFKKKSCNICDIDVSSDCLWNAD